MILSKVLYRGTLKLHLKNRYGVFTCGTKVFFPRYISKNLITYYLSTIGLGKREVTQPFDKGNLAFTGTLYTRS